MPYSILVDTQLPDEMLEMLGAECAVRLWPADASDSAFGAAVGIITYGHPRVDSVVMDRMPKLKVISNFGVGVDHIDLAAAKQRGIPVGNTPHILDGATADMTFTLLLAAARNLVIGERYARSPEFTHYDPNLLLGSEVHGATLGIVGMGNIGRQVARRARGFDMRVLYHNRNRNPQAEAELGVSYARLPDLLSQSDYVTLNLPLSAETRGMIGREQLRQMQPTAWLINVARGGVLDHAALVEALEQGWIAGAALDVTEPEPLPRDHPLLRMDNAIVAPHLGSATRQTRHAMARLTVDNLLAGLAGQPLPSRIA
ncbi:MAG TPA: D-glycerate dehydrogenase [Roseiflexaceae bacterium]|nr:D-glycerate dehydrogenase [Roseiflexaceae bacterium]